MYGAVFGPQYEGAMYINTYVYTTYMRPNILIFNSEEMLGLNKLIQMS